MKLTIPALALVMCASVAHAAPRAGSVPDRLGVDWTRLAESAADLPRLRLELDHPDLGDVTVQARARRQGLAVSFSGAVHELGREAWRVHFQPQVARGERVSE